MQVQLPVGELKVEAVVDFVQWVMNPLGLSLPLLGGLYLGKMVGEYALDLVITTTLKLVSFPLLPSRVNPTKTKGLERLEFKDWYYLGLNQFIEATFVSHLLALMLTLPRSADEVNVFNTVLAWYTCFLVDDFFYYWLHRAMHLQWLYPWIHKHHHRQVLPKRGYLDAANEHPLEQVGGLACVWTGLMAAQALFGLHAVTVLAFFGLFATFQFLNHTPYDVRLGAWALGYSVRAHEMHHRYLKCNYAQNNMWYDMLLGTFAEYKNAA